MVSFSNASSPDNAEPGATISVFKPFTMSDADFEKIRSMVYDSVGIDIKPHKKHLVINRLSKRLRLLGLPDFSSYLKYLERGENAQQEYVELVDAITTNKTDFLREPKHFDFLRDQVVPLYMQSKSAARFKVWSAACSSGEEPYTIAIYLSEIASKNPAFRFEINASDVSETILRTATTGIYADEKIKPIPQDLLRKYFLKGDQRYKVKPELAQNISFKKINLKHDFHRQLSGYNAIFLRNVMIYFDRPTQESIVKKCWHVLNSDGYLFLGLSETLHGSSVPFKYAAPSVYQKINNQ